MYVFRFVLRRRAVRHVWVGCRCVYGSYLLVQGRFVMESHDTVKCNFGDSASAFFWAPMYHLKVLIRMSRKSGSTPDFQLLMVMFLDLLRLGMSEAI